MEIKRGIEIVDNGARINFVMSFPVEAFENDEEIQHWKKETLEKVQTPSQCLKSMIRMVELIEEKKL